jgi:WD40 repeat protein
VIGVVVTVQLFDEPGGGRGESPDTRPEAFAVLSNFTDEVHSVEFSSDGETLVTTSGTEIKLWDTAGQLITRTPEIPYFASTSDGGQVKISADGNTLATAPDGSTPQLWDVDTGQVTATFPSHQGWALKQFSPDGEILATAGTCVCEEDFDNPVQLWNTTSGELIRSLSGHVNGVQSMEFSPDGTTLAAGAAGGGPVRLWNVTTGVPTANLTAGFMLKFSPDGKILATSGEFTAEEKAQLWDVTTGKVIATLIEGDPIAFSPDGKTLLTANPRTSNPETTAAHLWQVPSGTIERSSASLVTTPMAFASDNKSLAIADTDGTVRLWDFTSGDTTHTFVGHTGLINDLAISPDGKTLATAGKDRTVRLWQLP